MDQLFVRLLDRSFSMNRYVLNVTLTPRRFSVDATGGYDTAEIEVSGPVETMFALTDMLRCGVEIYDQTGQTIWQGILWTVELPWGNRTIGRSLDLAANTVQVAYSTPDSAVGRTSWVTNTRHSARYGVKELVGNLSDTALATAEAYRDALLAVRSVWPAPKIVNQRGARQTLTGKLVCIGLFKTLDWRYFTNSEVGLERLDLDGVEVSWTDQYSGPSDSDVEDISANMGAAVSNTQAYFWFTCNASYPVSLTSIQFKLRALGTPLDALIIDLVADNSGVPGTVIQTVAIGGTTIDTAANTWKEFAFSSLLLPGVRYGFVLRRSGAIDAVNYYRYALHTAAGYTNGQTRLLSSGVWTSLTSDIFFKLGSTGPALIDIGAVAARTHYAQKFTMDSASVAYGIAAIRLSVGKVGTPLDNIIVEIHDDSSGVVGALIGTAVVIGSLISTSPAEVLFTFPTGQVASRGSTTPLWMIIKRTAATDPINFFYVSANRTIPTFTIAQKFWNGSAYASQVSYAWAGYTVTYGAETTEQIRRIVAACGQFLTATDIRVNSGIYVPAFASGDYTALTLINELLNVGAATGGRLNARVTEDRRLQIFAEHPLDSDSWYEAEDGTIRTSRGTEVPDDMTVGVWLVPMGLPGGELSEDWAHFIEKTEWSDGVITRTSRDARDALDVFGVQSR